jgi:hypothetical protein
MDRIEGSIQAMTVYKQNIITQQATDFLVTYAAEEQRQYELCATLDQARDAYSEPPMGWTSLGISACRDGVPFASLDVPRVQYFRPRPVAAE